MEYITNIAKILFLAHFIDTARSICKTSIQEVLDLISVMCFLN